MSVSIVVEAATPGLRTDVMVTDHATQEPLRLTTYRGHVRLRREASIGILRIDNMLPVSFFLPDSLPYQEPPSALDVQVSLRHFHATASTNNPYPQGALDARVHLVPDPRGGPDQWLHAGFEVQSFFLSCEIGYVVTVASPYQRGV